MDKKAIKKELDEVLIQLKNNSKDARFADKLIDKAMSLKGQLDVVEMEFGIPASDVLKRYNFNSFELVKCKGGIVFHVFGGYISYTTMQMVSLYEHLNTVLEMYDSLADADENQKKVTDAVMNATFIDMQIPILIGTSDDFLFDFAELYCKKLQDLQDKMINSELQEETHEENAKFENETQMLNDFLRKDKDA